MSNWIEYGGIAIENVPGTSWMVGWGWRDTGVPNFAVSRACPGYVSDELRLACWDTLVASIKGVCDDCGAVVSMPPGLKTAGPDVAGYAGQDLLVHRNGCRLSGERLDELDRRDSPDGQGTPCDYSEASVGALLAYLRLPREVMR